MHIVQFCHGNIPAEDGEIRSLPLPSRAATNDYFDNWLI